MRTAICPGTFDPITNGHLDIIKRAINLFDRVIIGVSADNNKQTLFSLAERVSLIERVTEECPKVTVKSFSGLLIDFAHQEKAVAVVRGLRAVSDFEFEFQMSIMNKKLSNDVETLFLMTATEYSFISSSIIRQVASLGGCIKGLVPSVVEQALLERYGYI